MSPRSPVSAAFALAIALASVPAAAAGPSKAQCVAADDAAQPLRKQGHFAAAREQLRVCGDAACPAVVRADCVKMLDELEHAQPTIVFDVTDANGNDMVDVKVTMDGTVLTQKLGGTALEADPGEHTFTFEAPGIPAVTKTLLLRESEKDRHEHIVLAAAPPQPPAQEAATPSSGPAPAAPEPEPEAPGAVSLRTVGLVTGGVGVAAIAAGSVFGVLAMSANSAQKSDCASATDCKSYSHAVSDHSTVSTDATIATVAFIGGGVLVAAGAVLFFTGGPRTQIGSASLSLSPGVAPQQASLTLHGVF